MSSGVRFSNEGGEVSALDGNHKHLMRLIRKDRDATGWAKVSSVVWPFVQSLPKELVTLHDNGDGSGKARLTHDGETVLDWT